ncbi:hypothetical protein [Herbaspirillum sp. RV1423]|uniref:hypothetical protein n=1 Tax=Herbaspirillum sp. RV1423 TaxID=1443993 RepID=UPI0005555895|nr:hypothetical protein [Herbaspirillum sp. RV1423]
MIDPNAKRLFLARECHEKHGGMKHTFAYPAKNQTSVIGQKPSLKEILDKALTDNNKQDE